MKKSKSKLKSKPLIIGQKLKHKTFGFVGQLVCIDMISNVHVVECKNGEKKVVKLPVKSGLTITEYPSTIRWTGARYQVWDEFEFVD
jgi:hypothetical protein